MTAMGVLNVQAYQNWRRTREQGSCLRGMKRGTETVRKKLVSCHILPNSCESLKTEKEESVKPRNVASCRFEVNNKMRTQLCDNISTCSSRAINQSDTATRELRHGICSPLNICDEILHNDRYSTCTRDRALEMSTQVAIGQFLELLERMSPMRISPEVVSPRATSLWPKFVIAYLPKAKLEPLFVALRPIAMPETALRPSFMPWPPRAGFEAGSPTIVA